MSMYNLHSLEEYEKVMHLRNTFGWGSKRISSFLKNEHITGAKDTEPWKCKNCATAFKSRCRFWRNS